MKRYLTLFLMGMVITGLLALGCGKDNYKSPYNASQGAEVTIPDDYTYDSTGAALTLNLISYVTDSLKNNAPLNDIDMAVWIFPAEDVSSWASFYAGNLSITDFVDQDAPDFEGFDDDNIPHYTTDDNGRADVRIIIPFGFSGTIDVLFDIGVDSKDLTITVTPNGGTCFDGDDNDGDTSIDRYDCSDITGNES